MSRDHRANISVFYRFRATKKRYHLVESELNTRPLLTRDFFPSRTANSNLMSLKAHTNPLLAFSPQLASIVTTFYKDISVFNTAVCLSIHQSKLGISYQAWFHKGSLKRKCINCRHKAIDAATPCHAYEHGKNTSTYGQIDLALKHFYCHEDRYQNQKPTKKKKNCNGS